MNKLSRMMGFALLSILSTQTLSTNVHHHAKKIYRHRHYRTHKHCFAPKQVINFRRYLEPCLQPICAVAEESIFLNQATQNVGRALHNPCLPNWFHRIAITGGVNLDIGKWGNRNANLMGENYQRFSLNDIYINIDAEMTDWVSAFASLSYGDPTINFNPVLFNNTIASEYDAGYSNNINLVGPSIDPAIGKNRIQLEQAFGTIGNLKVQPFFFQFGKQFQDFSRYEIHPITLTLTQVLSEMLATSAKVGFIHDGFSGSLFVFYDPIYKINTTTNPNNYGIAAGYSTPFICEDWGWDLGAAYIRNIIGANNVAYMVQGFTGNGYHSHVSAFAVYVDINLGNFSFNGRYTAAIQRFVVTDIPKNGVADLIAIGVPLPEATGAKPWAGTFQLNYGFVYLNMANSVYLGYQLSDECGGLNMPERRIVLGYGVYPSKLTSLWVEWDKDYGYRRSNGGTGNITNLITLRVSTKFS